MKMSFKKIFLSVFLIIIVLLQAGCSATAKATPTPEPTAVKGVKAASGTVAEGSVVPVQNVMLGFSSIGTVEEIFKKDGDPVKKGDMIVRLSGQERLKASIAQAEEAILASQRKLKDLNENAALVKANAELKLANANDALKTEKEHRDWKNYRRGDQDQVDEARAKYIVAQDAVKTAEENYAGVASLGDEDINRAYLLTVLAQTRAGRDKAKEELNYLLEKPDQFELDIADAKIAVAQANVDAAIRDLEKVKDGPNPDDIAQVEASIKSAQSLLDSAKSSLDDLALTAPFDGSVVSNDLEIGQQVSPGAAAVSVANLSQWQVETTDLSELNVVAVKEGQPVTVTFDAIPDLELNGKVQTIQSLGVNKQGDITYKVIVQLAQQDDRLKWNMTALVSFTD
jgi:HlyD family secretion protein